MSDSRPKASRRLADRVASPYISGLAAQMSQIQDSIQDLHTRLDWLEAEIREIPPREERIKERVDELKVITTSMAAAAAAQIAEMGEKADAAHAHSRDMLRAVYERADEQRLRLYALRRTEDYELAFTEREPLVSVVIPTYNRYELLRDRSLPAILDQNYRNLKVIVSGDAAVPEIEQVVRDCGDPRVRYINRTINGPYPDDPQRAWMMRGTPPLNDGVGEAKGRWISIVCDDDEVTPDHTERLVEEAQQQRLELCYGKLKIRFEEGGVIDWDNTFPPAYRHFTLQLCVYHAGLRFFQFEPTDVNYGEPNDWSLVRRMVAAGVRLGRIDDLVVYRFEDRAMPEDY